MADVSANLKDWSTTASSNSPTDATTVGSGLADNLQEIQKVVRQDLANKGSDIASAGTTDIGAVAGSYHDITGTTTITSLGTVSSGIEKTLQFDNALQITHNATSLILPGGANIITSPGDHMRAMSLGSGNWVVPWYQRANGRSAAEAMTSRNIIHNASFDVWQRGTTVSSPASGAYTADRWYYLLSGSGAVTASQGTNKPTVAQAGRYVPNALQTDVGTADASIGAGDYYSLTHPIEGYEWFRVWQQTMTLSFWVYATVTGTYCVAIRSSGADRSYVREYTVSASNTWEFKTIVLTAAPSAGTWGSSFALSAYLHFTIACGSTLGSAANNTWQSANYIATANQVNGMSSTSNDFIIALPQLEAGNGHTLFDAMPFDAELARCQRYFCKSFPYATAPAQNTGSATGAINWINIVSGANGGGSQMQTFPVRMRASPTVTLYNPSAANAQIRNVSTSADWTSSAATASEVGLYVGGTQDAGAVAGSHRHAVHWSASAEL